MSHGARGQGRKGSERSRMQQDAYRKDMAAVALSQPTLQPRPAWMQDRALLPKKPPARSSGDGTA